MVHPAYRFFVWVSAIVIFCTLVCVDGCEKCPQEPVSNDACGSYSRYLSLNHGSGDQKMVPLNDGDGCRSELLHFFSINSGFWSEAQCLKPGDLDINRIDSEAALHRQSIRSDGSISGSSDGVVFRLSDGGSVNCSLNFLEFGHDKLTSIVNGADQTVLSSCSGHLLGQKEKSFSLWNIDVEKYTSSDSSSPCVSISPSKLNWGQNYLYHLSVASLTLMNTCNERGLKVYKPFTTDSQFFPFNFSEVVLGPGEVTSLSFVYLPNELGLSSAEVILPTSLGGFLVVAKGSAIESPYKLIPLVGLDTSSGEWLSRKLSISNPFDETIDLEEVTLLLSVFESSGSLLIESICRKQNPKGFSKFSFSSDKLLNGDTEQSDSIIMTVRPLANWLISPHKSQSVLEMAFSSDSERKVVGAICMELFRPLKDEKDMLVIPFETELKKTEPWKDTTSSLSVSMEAVGLCDTSETTISVSVRNRALTLLKIVKINEAVDSRKILKIKYLEGLLLFPGSTSQVAIVTYKSSNMEYDSFLEIPGVSTSCKLEILVNDSTSPLIEVPCLNIFAVCPRQQRRSSSHISDIADLSNRKVPLTNPEKTPILTKALDGAVKDDFFHEEWRTQSSMSGLYLLDNHELLFPLLPVGKYYDKSITVRNPSQQPVVVQLILNSIETVDNCKTCYGHQQKPSASSSTCNDSTRMSMCGFSVADGTVTEAFLHPNGTASLGPIYFHPSDRCEWKSSAFIRSNLSGLEILSLHGSGGSFSLVLLEGSEHVQRLDFTMNYPLNISNNEDAKSACRKPLLKKVFAFNAGDYPVNVKRIDVSGRECGLDGFVVHNCQGFSLKPGESLELGLSYQPDLSGPVVQRELELILDAGILVIPMQASIPPNSLNVCVDSFFWSPVKCCLAIGFVIILLSLSRFKMPSETMDSSIEGEKRSIPVVRLTDKSSSTVSISKENRKGTKPAKTGRVKQVIIAEHTDRFVACRAENTPLSEHTNRAVKNACKPEVAQPDSLTIKTRKEKRRRSRKRHALIEVSSSQSGNSTPSSPLSPITTLSPPETCSPSPKKLQPNDCFSSEPLAAARVPEMQSQNLISTQQKPPGGSKKMESQATLLPSVSCPRTHISPSRLAMEQHARAPGPKIHPPKAVQPEENMRAEEDRFTYDIWGNHFSGLHLCRTNSSLTMTSEAVGHSNSFFLRGPQQTLIANSPPPSVSSFCDEG
ncbi:uncharacterized protein LOC110682278 [Chenopodium quinoa]|uniref:Transmembrane protein 131-like N-terminal domain-containing protein n=1 Tax=Chenopodium quinoa TaxID=63459 RepID=A0A803KXU6_CHEQI|nr:uncharacterized protein LOC110682278 [Chenopodium quinoa]